MAYSFLPRSNQPTNRTRLNAADFEPLLDSIEAAALLHIHPKTLQKMARRGQIQGRHVGKCWRFRASDLNEWLWRQERVS
jgi:excisionase family DNA binding protein